MIWSVVTKFDRRAVQLADGHYSRRKPGSSQFMPPGQTLVLWQPGAVFGWWRPDPKSGIVAMNGLDGWTCTIFRRIGGGARLGADSRGGARSCRVWHHVRPRWALDLRVAREGRVEQPGLLLQARRLGSPPGEARVG